MTWYARRNRKTTAGDRAKHERTEPAKTEQPADLCKISDEFARRLAHLAPDETVRAVVMPAPYLRPGGTDTSGRRLRGAERQAMLREARRHTEESFHEIDDVLAQTGGRRLTTCGNAFGYIVIETNAAGIDAVSALEWVNAVMEDQPIYPQRDPGQLDQSADTPEDHHKP